MQKVLKTYYLRYILLFLILLSNFSTFFLLFAIVFFGGILLFLNFSKSNLDERFFFFIGLIFLTAVQFLFFLSPDYGKNYFINTSIALLLWGLALLCYLVVKTSVLNLKMDLLKRLLDVFFLLNIFLIGIQYLLACFETKSPIPFLVNMHSYGMSTGDHLKGLFANSSVTMVVMGFYTVYYGVSKIKKVYLAAIAMLLTTYMSGIVMFVAVLSAFAFFSFSFKNKIK